MAIVHQGLILKMYIFHLFSSFYSSALIYHIYIYICVCVCVCVCKHIIFYFYTYSIILMVLKNKQMIQSVNKKNHKLISEEKIW